MAAGSSWRAPRTGCRSRYDGGLAHRVEVRISPPKGMVPRFVIIDPDMPGITPTPALPHQGRGWDRRSVYPFKPKLRSRLRRAYGDQKPSCPPPARSLDGEGLGGGDPVEIFGDHRVHALRIVQNLVVPEPQDAVPLALQEPSAARLLMLAAIDLDDRSRLVAGEAGNEPADRHLTAKPVPWFAEIAGFAGAASRLRSSRGEVCGRAGGLSRSVMFSPLIRPWRHHPHPGPPPSRGRV
jgi:hypothetical protein